MTPQLTIVLLNWQTRNLLHRSLTAALRSTVGLAVQCLVVDNGSDDGSVDLVRQKYAGQVDLIALERNYGPAHGFNVGLKSALGRNVMLLNSDAFLRPEAVRALLTFLDEHAEYGVVVPKLINKDGTTQRAVMRFPTRATLLWHDSLLERLWPHNPWRQRYLMADFDHEVSRDVDQPPQAVMVVRREVIEQVGLLDEMMPIYFNDVDWCWRIRRAGWRIRYLADESVVHIGGATARQLTERWAHIFRDRIRYARKRFGPTGGFLAKLAVRSLAWCEVATCLSNRSVLWKHRWQGARKAISIARDVTADA